MVWYGLVWFAIVLYSFVQFGMVWYGMVWFGIWDLGFRIQDLGFGIKQSDVEDIIRMLARVKVRKEEQEEMEATDYTDNHIIPNLPPGYNNQEDV